MVEFSLEDPVYDTDVLETSVVFPLLTEDKTTDLLRWQIDGCKQALKNIIAYVLHSAGNHLWKYIIQYIQPLLSYITK